MIPFVITGLPRSRTAWLSAFLSRGDVVCLHEPSGRFWRDLGDLDRFLATPNTGAADPMLTLLWRDIVERRPDVRLVAVRRPIDEVFASAVRLGIDLPANRSFIEKIAAALEEVEALPQTLCVKFDDLRHFETAAAVYRHCLGQDLDRAWWLWSAQRIVVNPAVRMAEAVKNRDGIINLYGRFLPR